MKIMFHNNKISHKINKYNQINTYNKKKFTFSKKKIIKMMDKNKQLLIKNNKMLFKKKKLYKIKRNKFNYEQQENICIFSYLYYYYYLAKFFVKLVSLISLYIYKNFNL